MKTKYWILATVATAVTAYLFAVREGGAEPAVIKITSPAPGAIYAPGDMVTVTVEPVGAYIPESVGVLTPMGVRMYNGAPYSDVFQLPLDSIGTQEIRAIATANGGSQIDAAPVVIFQVQVSASLTGIRAPNGTILGASLANNPSIYVVGQYDDGVDRNLSGADLGTTYVSNNTEIATVDQNGIVTGIRDGSTSVSVFNGSFAVNIDVLVSGVSAAPQFRLVPFADDLYVDELFQYTLSASDSDGTIPILTVENLPANATFADNSDGTANFSWTPTLSDIGSYGVVFTATDAVDPTMDGGFVFAFNVKARP